jgi:hypothetical protein
MKKNLILALACAGLATSLHANSFTFNNFGSGDLGAGAQTFSSTPAGLTLTVTTDPANHLFGKTGGGDETGLGLTGTADNEITPTTWISLTVPTGYSLNLVFLGSVQAGEKAFIYSGTTAGAQTTLLHTSVGDDSFDVSGVTGFITIIGGGPGGANVLLDSVTASTPNVPDGGTTLALLGGALTVLGLVRRKLVA